MRNLASLAFILVVAWEANLTTAAAQAHPSAPPAPSASAQRGPDLLGIYPGMPAAEARRRLQAYSGAARVEDIARDHPEYGFSLKILRTEPAIGTTESETITVHTTLPPSPSVVWVIDRGVTYFMTDKMVAKSTFLATLREKYGKETASEEFGTARNNYWWLFDQNGQRVASADPRMLRNCQAVRWQKYTPTMGTAEMSAPLPAQSQPCLSSYYALNVHFQQSHGPEFVDNFQATLVNLPLGYRAAVATVNAKNAAAEAARKQELEKAKQKKPVF